MVAPTMEEKRRLREACGDEEGEDVVEKSRDERPGRGDEDGEEERIEEVVDGEGECVRR